MAAAWTQAYVHCGFMRPAPLRHITRKLFDKLLIYSACQKEVILQIENRATLDCIKAFDHAPPPSRRSSLHDPGIETLHGKTRIRKPLGLGD